MIGKMRHRVVLESRSTVVGDGGRKTITYAEIATVWVSIEPQALDAEISADRLEFAVAFTITCHFSKDYLDTRRIRFGSRIFTVKSVLNPGEANQKLVFRAEEE
jgi:SPP1 family predicted phage head-tail adaptor